MIEVVVRAASRLSAGSGYLRWGGEDSWKSAWVWLVPESWQFRTDERVEVPDELALPCPADVPGDRLPAVLAYWPAWRVTEWARLENGSGVLIVGAGGLGRQVADLCQCRGTPGGAASGERRMPGMMESCGSGSPADSDRTTFSGPFPGIRIAS